MAATTTPDSAPSTAPTATALRAPRPSWTEASIWMGASAGALLGLWWRHRFRIAPRYAFDAAIDLAFATSNGIQGLIERACYARSLAQQSIDHPPVFILGHWRTGTTLLHELCQLDPRLRAPTTYECFLPHHFRLSQRTMKRWVGFVLPRTRQFDAMPMGWDHPQEDEFALLNLGLPGPYARIAFPNDPPRDEAWLDLDELAPRDRERWERTMLRFCRRLLAERAGRLVLKSPPHTCRVPTLLKLFPDARFVYLVRDPAAVIPSTIKLWKSLFETHGYQYANFGEEEVERVLRTFAHFHERFEQTRGLIPPQNLAVLRYDELVADPPGVVERLYEQLSLGSFAEVAEQVTAFCAAQREYRPNRHSVDERLQGQMEERCGEYARMYGYK